MQKFLKIFGTVSMFQSSPIFTKLRQYIFVSIFTNMIGEDWWRLVKIGNFPQYDWWRLKYHKITINHRIALTPNFRKYWLLTPESYSTIDSFESHYSRVNQESRVNLRVILIFDSYYYFVTLILIIVFLL